nr:7046_t:CDS:10 [Entrophospora candida]
MTNSGPIITSKHLETLKKYLEKDTIERGYVYYHQKVNIELDIVDQFIKGYTEIHLKPIRFDIHEIKLNCRQCGEIIIQIPDEMLNIPILDEGGEWIPIIVNVDFTLEKPKSGIYFKQPDSNIPNKPNEFYEPNANIENFDRMMVVTSGNLLEIIESPNNHHNKRLFHYRLPVPIQAQHIGLVCGPFRSPYILHYPGENDLPENRPLITAYFPSRLEEWIRPTLYPNQEGADTFWIHWAFDYFIEGYSHFKIHPEFDKRNPKVKPGKFPFNCFHIVFVENAYNDITVCAGMVICRTSLLYNEHIIEQVFVTRRLLINAIAQQWFGIFIPPHSWRDFWLAIGLSNYFTTMYLEKIFGEQEIQLSRKLTPIETRELEFLNLKAPLVLWMLNNRLPFFDYHRGILGIIYLILNRAKETSYHNFRPGYLETKEFFNLCKDVIRQELRDEIKQFKKQWIYGSGCPIFKINANFNRKKMTVEFKFVQQNSNLVHSDLEKKKSNDKKSTTTHADDHKKHTSLFTGQMDIAINEPDGVEYIHTIYIREKTETFSLPYHTKYKRSKITLKPRFVRKRGTFDSYVPLELIEEQSRIYPVLWGMDPEINERDEWKIIEWADPSRQQSTSDHWDWILIDRAFSWIGKFDFEQPDYMWASQLESEGSVAAQYEFYNNTTLEKSPSAACSTTLLRTLRDWRYHYRCRTSAAMAMAKCATNELNYIGLHQLLKTYEYDYCERVDDQIIPKTNNFSDWEEYFVQKSIPIALSNIRQTGGVTPVDVKETLVDMLNWNDNSENPYADDYLVATYIESLGYSFVQFEEESDQGVEIFDLAGDSNAYLKETLEILNRYKFRNDLFNSYHSVILSSIIMAKARLMMSQVINVDGKELLVYTIYDNYINVRITALKAIIDLELHKKPEVMSYINQLIETDPDLGVRKFLQYRFGSDFGPYCWDLPIKKRTYPLLKIKL